MREQVGESKNSCISLTFFTMLSQMNKTVSCGCVICVEALFLE